MRSGTAISLSQLFRDNSLQQQKIKKPTGLTVGSNLQMVGVTELESVTSTMSTWRSNQLSYTPEKDEAGQKKTAVSISLAAALHQLNGGRNRTRICDLHDVNVAL